MRKTGVVGGRRTKPKARPRPTLGYRPRGAASGIDAAAQGSLVPKYPAALDTAPTIDEDRTVLSAIFTNFLALVVESIEAEIGIIAEGANEATWIGGGSSLMDMLAKISHAGGSHSGKLLGIERFSITKARNAFNTEAIITFSGYNAASTKPLPIVFMSLAATNVGGSTSKAPFKCNGYAYWASATTIKLHYKGGPTDSRTDQVTVEGIIFHMPQD